MNLEKVAYFAISASVSAMLIASTANAATVSQEELAALIAEAKSNGVAAVQIHLSPASMSELANNLDAVKSTMRRKLANLVSELGATALTSGRWQNDVGQVGLYVTEDGLAKLQRTANAVSFTRDKPWYARTSLDGGDGSLQEVNKQLNTLGYVDVVVTMNVDGMQHDTTRTGEISYSAPGKSQSDVMVKVQSLAASAPTDSIVINNPGAEVANTDKHFNPQVTLRLNREGVLAVATSGAARRMATVGYKNIPATVIDPSAINRAKTDGYVDVLVTLRNPLAGGKIEPSSFDGIQQSNKRAMKGLLRDAGIDSPLTADYSEFGVFRMTLSLKDLNALAQSNDARLLAVEMNKALAEPLLSVSTPTLNMASAWNANPPVRGAGQNIIVMDTGVQSDHIFFQNASGGSRVVYEACFGSTENVIDRDTNTPYTVASACANGANSILGVAGSAAPIPNCSALSPGACAHGTHVAGISAGRTNTQFGLGVNFQGIAPDANIVAVQVFSYDINRLFGPRAITADLVSAMQAVVAAIVQGTQNNPYVVNISIGGELSASSCDNVSLAFAQSIQMLTNNGVPVVVATGNNSSNGRITWPACVNGTIKVGSVANDGIGTVISTFTNRPDMAAIGFSTSDVFMVPGGQVINGIVTSSIFSSVPDFTFGNNRNGVGGMYGTSMAAPHVAGLYALYKSAVPGTTVQGATSWIQNNAGTALAPVCSSGTCRPYFRIRLP